MHVYLAIWVRAYVNRKLSEIPGYRAQAQAVTLHPCATSVEINLRLPTCQICKGLWLFELGRVLMRLNHIVAFIVNADHIARSCNRHSISVRQLSPRARISFSAKRRRKLPNNPSQYNPHQPQRDKKPDDLQQELNELPERPFAAWNI